MFNYVILPSWLFLHVAKCGLIESTPQSRGLLPADQNDHTNITSYELTAAYCW